MSIAEDIKIVSVEEVAAEDIELFLKENIDPITRLSIAENSDKTIALYDGKIVAYADFRKARPNKFCAIGVLFVAPAHREKGIALNLLSKMESIAREKYNAKEMAASTNNQNKPAIELYTRQGYTPYDIEKNTTPQGEQTLLIRLKKTLR